MKIKLKASVFFIILMISATVLFLKAQSPFGLIFWIALWGFVLSLIALVHQLGIFLLNKKSILYKIPAFAVFLFAALMGVAVLLVAWDYRIIIPISTAKELTANERKTDIDYLKSQLITHPGYNSLIDSLSNILFEDLYENTENIGRDDHLMKIMNLVGLFQDGHSSVPRFQVFNRSRYLPLSGYYFEDGYYILSAADEYALLENKKLI